LKNFTEAYKKAKTVLDTTTAWPADWTKLLSVDAPVRKLYGPDGFAGSEAGTPGKLRQAVAEKSRGAVAAFFMGGGPGEVLYAAADKNAERAAALKFTKHVYRAHHKGGQDVWIYSPPKDHKAWIFDDLGGGEKAVQKRLDQETELFTDLQKQHMCAALALALKISEDTRVKLGAADDKTKALVRHWFLDADCGDAQLTDAMTRLSAGFQKISVCCNSSTLVFTDYPDWHAKRDKVMGGAIPGGEGGGFPVVYIEGAFTGMAGQAGNIWTCARTVIHEFSHHEIKTEDHRYRHDGLKPDKAGFPYAKTITNADSWAVFAVDLAGYLPKAEQSSFYV